MLVVFADRNLDELFRAIGRTGEAARTPRSIVDVSAQRDRFFQDILSAAR
jgi:hypothetical protein